MVLASVVGLPAGVTARKEGKSLFIYVCVFVSFAIRCWFLLLVVEI